MESEKSQRARLIRDLSKSITYWIDTNPNEEFAEAYIMMLNAFSNPTYIKERKDENTTNAEQWEG